MKTPVAALRMEVDTLRRKDVEWPREFVEETVEDIADEVKRLEHLVTDWCWNSSNRERIQTFGIVYAI